MKRRAQHLAVKRSPQPQPGPAAHSHKPAVEWGEGTAAHPHPQLHPDLKVKKGSSPGVKTSQVLGLQQPSIILPLHSDERAAWGGDRSCQVTNR